MQKHKLLDRLYHYSYQLEMALSNKDDMQDFLDDAEIWLSEIKTLLNETAGLLGFELDQETQADQEKYNQEKIDDIINDTTKEIFKKVCAIQFKENEPYVAYVGLMKHIMATVDDRYKLEHIHILHEAFERRKNG